MQIWHLPKETPYWSQARQLASMLREHHSGDMVNEFLFSLITAMGDHESLHACFVTLLATIYLFQAA